MVISDVLKNLDILLHDCRLDEAEKYLIESIHNAQLENDIDSEKILLNELIGFYRDCGRFKEGIGTAQKAIEIFENENDRESVEYATTMLNAANLYRAASDYKKSFDAYDTVEKIYKKSLNADDLRQASLLNNKALLYQEINDWNKACLYLEKALDIVKKSGDEIKIAVSYTNLAVSLININEMEKAEKYLDEAEKIFEGRTPSDFHYSAYLAGKGDFYLKNSNYSEAAEYYEKALSEIELHMGRNNFYDIVSEKLENAYKKSGMKRADMKGTELCKKYYKSFAEPVIKRNFSEILNYIAIGVAGEGSECFGYDDDISRDHDFGPGFCIWVSDSLSDEWKEKLNKMYKSLPKTFMGFKRIETSHSSDRMGVCSVSNFCSRILGTDHIPQNNDEWLSIDDSAFASFINGEIFLDTGNIITGLREQIRGGYPEYVKLVKLAQQTALMAQCGQYNYSRMVKRGDYTSAAIYLSDFSKSAMRAAHICSGKYYPYKKWLYRSLKSLTGFEKTACLIEKLFLPDKSKTEEIIEKICLITEEKITMKQSGAYLGDLAEELYEKAQNLNIHDDLVRKIVLLEWKSFDSVQNIGGRASCQDDWETFSIMRRSQYNAWTDDLLRTWTENFELILSEGRNPIAEKYAYMMESTDPEEFERIKDDLPPISGEFRKMREAIIDIQISWMEEFSSKYPNLAKKSRKIHTSEDTLYETSYETYLRGELSVYSFEMLYQYAAWIVSLCRSEKNLAEIIMENTIFEYGYKSIEDAEKV